MKTSHKHRFSLRGLTFLLIAFGLAGCHEKTANFFEALAAPPPIMLFPAPEQFVGLTMVPILYTTQSNNCPLTVEPQFTVPVDFTIELGSNTLSFLATGAPEETRLSGVYNPANGLWPATHVPVVIGAGDFIQETHSGGFTLDGATVTYNAPVSTVISGVTLNCTIQYIASYSGTVAAYP